MGEQREPPEHDPASQRFVPPRKHLAADRFAGGALRSAQAIGEGLAEAGVGDDDEPVVVDRAGPRHSLDALDRMLSSALEAEESDRATDRGEVSRDRPPAER